MYQSQLKRAEKYIAEVAAIHGEDSKTCQRAREDYEQTLSAWNNTPEEFKVFDVIEVVAQEEVKPEPLKINTVYFNDENGVLTELKTHRVLEDEIYSFKYPEKNERYMVETFKDVE